MSNKIILLNINEQLDPVDESKLETVKTIQPDETLVIIGSEANKFVTNNAIKADNIFVYDGEVAIGLVHAYKNHIEPNIGNLQVEFRIITAEYPVLRLLVERIIGDNQFIQYVVLPSGVRNFLYNEMMSFQRELMSKYIVVLENIETANADAVLEAVSKPYAPSV